MHPFMKKTEEFSPDEVAQRLKMARAIRARREELGLTQQQLATALGRSVANIRTWERESPPAAIPGGAIAMALGRALQSTPSRLFIGLDLATTMAEEVTRIERDAAYPSLQEFLDEHGEQITPDEREWLTSQRFAEGDPGDMNWWAGQLMAYRKRFKFAGKRLVEYTVSELSDVFAVRDLERKKPRK